MRKYFGTDGIRGKVNGSSMTADMALRLGMAVGHVFRRGEYRHRVVIGKDTRLSGYMIEASLVAGFTSMGMDVFLVGPMPTPGVAFLTRTIRADVGVMISASHNHFEDNGIKLFDANGYKLSDDVEAEIESYMDSGVGDLIASPQNLGRTKRIDDAQARYIEFAKNTLPRCLDLGGIRIVVDCAHGAAYKVAPTVLWELGADVIPIGVEPDGFNINAECGSTHIEPLQQTVLKEKADIGVAFDGDADRLIVCDEKGQKIDGDQMLGLIATNWHQENKLSSSHLVTTVMSNLGLERYLKNLDIDLIRTCVGDRYVMKEMREWGVNLGGEKSGHIIMSDFATTGDGLIAALQILSVMQQQDCPMSELGHVFTPLAQLLKNVCVSHGQSLQHAHVQEVIHESRKRLGDAGRIVVRESGTEPLIRIMGEGDDNDLIHTIVNDIATSLEAVTA